MADETANDPRKWFNHQLKQLQDERGKREPQFREVVDYITPILGRFDSIGRDEVYGDYTLINNSTAEFALDTLSSGLMAGLTSPARPWFRLTTGRADMQKNTVVNRYLNDLRDYILGIFQRSGLYQELPKIYKELGGFGTAVLLAEEDDDRVMTFRALTMGEYYIRTDMRGNIIGLYFEHTYSVADIIDEFGYDNVSDGVRRMFDDNLYEEEVKVIQAIDMVRESMPEEAIPQSQKWTHVFYEPEGMWDDGNSYLLDVSGFNEFPAMAVRWDVVSNDVYGHGPGVKALPDIKQLQQHELQKMRALDLMNDPPVQIPSTMDADDIDLNPGEASFYDPHTAPDGIRPVYHATFPIAETTEAIREKEQKINRAFFADLFRMLMDSDRRQITAEEIIRQQEEKLLLLGPTLMRVDAELLDNLIHRTIRVSELRDEAPVRPDELLEEDLKIEYVSVLAQAQKAVGTQAIERVNRHVGELVQMTGDPSHFDVLNTDANIRDYAEFVGLDPDGVKSEAEVAQLRQQRAQQQQLMQGAEMAQGYSNAAKSLAETKLADETALAEVRRNFTGI